MIKLEHVSKFYKTKTGVSEGMRDVSAEFDLGEFVAVTGESGSGKTTLLNVISGLDSYEDGELYVNGKETSHYTVKEWEEFRAANVGFVFQNYNVIDSYSVYQNVVIALEAQGYNESDKKMRALDLIDKVGLLTHKDQKTSKLSGGQKQRVVIARALAKNAPIILADEPTGNLDAQSGKEIMELLKEISKDKLIILVTHNYEQAKPYVTRKLVMHDATIKEDTTIIKSTSKDVALKTDYDNTNTDSFKTSSKIAFRNILATPKRTIFSLLLSILVIASFLLFYSSLIKNNANQLAGSYYAQRAYIELREENKAFDKPSYEEVKTKYESKDLEITFEMPISTVVESITDFSGGFQVRTASRISESDLSGGRLPTKADEIVVFSYLNIENYNIDKKLKLYFQDNETPIEFTIVGFADTSKGDFEQSYFRDMFFYNEFLISDNLVLNANVFKETNIYQLLVLGIDREEVVLLKNKIDNDKYRIYDPYLQQEKNLEFVTGAILLIFWTILLAILSVLFLVSYNVLKNVMESRKKDFAVYRSIGISEREVGITILIEQLIIAITAVVVTVIVLNLLATQILFIRQLTRHLTLGDYLLVSFIFGLFSVYQGLKFNKKIFNITVIESLREEN